MFLPSILIGTARLSLLVFFISLKFLMCLSNRETDFLVDIRVMSISMVDLGRTT